VETEFPANRLRLFYEQIISDFRSAGLALPGEIKYRRGRFTKAAAYHFLAKAYLTRGSAVTEARGQKATDMDSALFLLIPLSS
jgi:hypothetical protein